MPDSLEERVAALEQAVAALQAPSSGAPPDDGAHDPQFWLLNELQQRHVDHAIVFGGTADVGRGDVAWQWGAPSDRVLEQDWEPAAAILDALSHPVRLRLLQHVLNGRTTTAELAADQSLGTTGQLHHHLRALVAAGWLTSTGRGSWSVPGPRVVPLLVVVLAATSR